MGFLSSIAGRFGTKFKELTEPKLKFGPKLLSEIPSKLGPQGEEVAAGYLQRQGYQLLERNFRAKPGEIDIIARDGDTLCFVEVKTRASKDYGSGLESITTLKKRKLCQTALLYLTQNHLTDAKARFDVVSIQLEDGGRHEVELIRNAFEVNEGLF